MSFSRSATVPVLNFPALSLTLFTLGPSAPTLAVVPPAQAGLVLRLQGQGFPQMPAGGVSPEQLEEVQSWIHAGAPLPH